MAANPAPTRQASHSRDDPVVTGLVTRATDGDRQAWDALIDRYAPLVWSICRRHRLEAADAQDAAQTVWLKLVEHLDKIRDPAALPGWLATPDMPSPRPSQTITPRRPNRTCSRPNGTRPCGRRSGSCPPAASSCSPCSPPTRQCRTPRSAPGWASRSAASGRPAAAAWASYAATRPSPR